MSYQTNNYMLVGFRYEYIDFKDMAVDWFQSTDANFKETYESQLKVVEIMPKYQQDLDRLKEKALDEFYFYLEEQGVVRISEHRGFDYIGFPVDATIKIDDESLSDFFQTVKEKSKRLSELLGKCGSLMATHDYS